MKVTGSHIVKAPRERVWHMLQDPEVLSQATPGVKEMEREREDFYRAVLELGIGPVKGTFSGHVEVTDKREPDLLTLSVDGSGGPGGVKAIGVLRLEEDPNGTVVHYEGEPQISGRLASVGVRLVGGVAKKLAGQFFESVDKQAQGYETSAHPSTQSANPAVKPV